MQPSDSRWTAAGVASCTLTLGGGTLERPLDAHAFLLTQQARQKTRLTEGQYLGFFIPGQRVILRRIEEAIAREAPQLVTCSLRCLFEQ